jgi:chemotaxis protein histidine kinase CheA
MARPALAWTRDLQVPVERMGGRIWCENEPGKGATFFAELPRAIAVWLAP